MSRVFVIAEAGVNHNGSPDLALALVEAAARAGADAVKFQTFRAEAVISRSAPKAEYQVRTTGAVESQLEMVRKLELSRDAHRMLADRCATLGIQFMSTPFDLDSARFLAGDLGVRILKIPSGEVTNGPLLLGIARLDKPVILSTGMSTLEEVKLALGVLAYGYLADSTPPGEAAFRDALASEHGRAVLSDKVTLLHCTTEYPAPYDQVNLRAMDTLATTFGLPVGLSDHTVGTAVAIAAAARGAVAIEKHLTLDRGLPGPDHLASIEPDELAAMVASIRQVEQALGSPLKQPAPAELSNRIIARRSLVAAAPVRVGETWTEANLVCKRPGGGLSPMTYWNLLGKPAGRDYLPDEPILPE